VDRLVLLAPAFDFWTRWAESPEWQSGKLSLFHYGEKRRREVHYGLIEDARGYPAYPDFPQPALVLHGLRDDVVPVEYARRFCASHPNAKLVELDSGHELTNVLPQMWAMVETFLFT
jgi:pimeloyl-ACP methyl ester carboxylesterase